jgi:uncharacterized protein (DUF58 family)
MAAIIIAGSLLIAILGFSILQKAVYHRHWNKELVFSLLSSKSAVFEGEKVTITDSLTNRKRLPLPWVHVSYKLSRFLVFLDNVSKKVSRGEWRILLFIVGVNKTVSRKSTVLCSKRGYYTATEITVASNNLFMTGYVTEDVSSPFNLLVYPRVVSYSESIIPLKKMLGDISVRRFTDPDPFTFKGVREYQPYDSFRQINWNATAKTGEIMSNIYDFTVYQDISVLLDIQNYTDHNRNFVHEEAIRIAAFICRNCIDRGIPVSLVCPAPDGNPTHISSGLSNAHLEKVYATLAFINLDRLNNTIVDYIPDKKDAAYILISSSGEKQVIEIISGGETIAVEVIEDA